MFDIIATVLKLMVPSIIVKLSGYTGNGVEISC